MYLKTFGLETKQARPNDHEWTGTEIRSCCRLAALLDVPLTTAAQNVVPVAVTAAESVHRLRDWAGGRCLNAEAPGIYLMGLWLSGLRLEESLVLSWEDDAPISVDLSGRRPRLRIYAEAEKGHQDRLLPIMPDFAQFLLRTPEDERSGVVFKVEGLFTGKPMTPRRVGRVVSAIGKRANVVVNKADGKYASAHDFRRAFGIRWARKVMPSVLQKLMRHDSIETTLRYYVDLDADEMAEELWKMSGTINTSINTRPPEAHESEKESD